MNNYRSPERNTSGTLADKFDRIRRGLEQFILPRTSASGTEPAMKSSVPPEKPVYAPSPRELARQAELAQRRAELTEEQLTQLAMASIELARIGGFNALGKNPRASFISGRLQVAEQVLQSLNTPPKLIIDTVEANMDAVEGIKLAAANYIFGVLGDERATAAILRGVSPQAIVMTAIKESLGKVE